MKRLFACFFLSLLGCIFRSFSGALIDEPPVDALKGTLLPGRFQAQVVAEGLMGKQMGLSCHVKTYAPELIRSGFTVPGFVERGDLLWEVRYCDGLLSRGNPLQKGLGGILWIHPQTVKTKWWWFKGEEACAFDYPFQIDDLKKPFVKRECVFPMWNLSTGEEVQVREITYYCGERIAHVRCEPADEKSAVVFPDNATQAEFRYWDMQSPLVAGQPPHMNGRPTQDDFAVGTKDQAIDSVDRKLKEMKEFELEECSYEVVLIPSFWNSENFCLAGDWLWDVRVTGTGGEAESSVAPAVYAEMLVHAASGAISSIVGPSFLGHSGVFKDKQLKCSPSGERTAGNRPFGKQMAE